MKRIAGLPAIALLAFLPLARPALAQSACPSIVYGAVLTPAQWNACFMGKQDVGTGGGAATFPYTPLNKAGDSMLGELFTAPSIAASAPFNIPPGAAPTSPQNGDIWATSAGVFARVNGVTVGPLGAPSGLGFTPVNKAGDTMTGELVLPASASGGSGFNIPQGAAPSAPVNGDIWTTILGLFVRANSVSLGPLVAANQNNNYTARQTNQPVVLTDGVTITPNFLLGNLFTVTLGGNRTLANPTNLSIGMSFCIKFTNGVVGGVAGITSWGTAYQAPGGVATIPFTQAQNAVDEICGRSYDGTSIQLTVANNYSH